MKIEENSLSAAMFDLEQQQPTAEAEPESEITKPGGFPWLLVFLWVFGIIVIVGVMIAACVAFSMAPIKAFLGAATLVTTAALMARLRHWLRQH